MCTKSPLEVVCWRQLLSKRLQICVVQEVVSRRWFWGPKCDAFSISLEVENLDWFVTDFGPLLGGRPGWGVPPWCNFSAGRLPLKTVKPWSGWGHCQGLVAIFWTFKIISICTWPKLCCHGISLIVIADSNTSADICSFFFVGGGMTLIEMLRDCPETM